MSFIIIFWHTFVRRKKACARQLVGGGESAHLRHTEDGAENPRDGDHDLDAARSAVLADGVHDGHAAVDADDDDDVRRQVQTEHLKTCSAHQSHRSPDTSRLETCMGMGTQLYQNGNGNGKSTRDSGNGNGYFFMCAKIPIGRLDVNVIQ